MGKGRARSSGAVSHYPEGACQIACLDPFGKLIICQK
jgi:hypothetical protein